MKIQNALFIILLIFGSLVSVAVADDGNFSMDKIYSKDTVLGYQKKSGDDAFNDLTVSNMLSVMESLPTSVLIILGILLLAGAVFVGTIISILWNMWKMSNASRKENTHEAVKEIHGHKKNNRELGLAIAEGVVIIAIIIGGLFLFR